MTTTTLVATAFGHTASLYDALQCAKQSDSSELKRAYRRQALKYHPDKAALKKQRQTSTRSSSSDNNNAVTNQTGTTSSSATIQNNDTLKFQAVSAAYSVLRSRKRRTLYDTTGQVRDDNDNDNDDDDETTTTTTTRTHQYNNFRSRGRSSTASHRSNNNNNNNDDRDQQHWDHFFHSVFQEIVTTGVEEEKHDYRGSGQENHDVLYYYTICKGNYHKIVDCIIHGEIGDMERWKKDIVNPAIQKGNVVRYSVYNFDDDADDDDDDDRKTKVVKRGMKKKKKRLRKLSDSLDRTKKISIKKASFDSSSTRKVNFGYSNNSSCILDNTNSLVDTDDENEEELIVSTKTTTTTHKNDAHSFSPHGDNDHDKDNDNDNDNDNDAKMNRKDKLEYHAATKRKQKAQKDKEFAKLLNSKTWRSDNATTSTTQQQEQQEQTTVPLFTEALLSRMEKKYSATVPSGKRKRF